MSHAAPHAADDSHAAGAHSEPVESPEARAERETSERVTQAIGRNVARPLGFVLAVVGAGVTLALLRTLSASAEPTSWAWLLPGVLVTAWGIALTCSGRVPVS